MLCIKKWRVRKDLFSFDSCCKWLPHLYIYNQKKKTYNSTSSNLILIIPNSKIMEGDLEYLRI